ncbi:MAG: DUF1294 domain-containing protein [Anaerolineaceae bacterium]
MILVYFFLAISLVSFLLWGVDKYRAIQQQWRIPENWLIGLTVCGGALGALAGMLVFRHKIRKPFFWILVITFLILQGLLVILFTK